MSAKLRMKASMQDRIKSTQTSGKLKHRRHFSNLVFIPDPTPHNHNPSKTFNQAILKMYLAITSNSNKSILTVNRITTPLGTAQHLH